jgi:hypothetical protein
MTILESSSTSSSSSSHRNLDSQAILPAVLDGHHLFQPEQHHEERPSLSRHPKAL